MESLYLLIPLSAGLVLVILAVFAWAVQQGQFEDLDAEGERILSDEALPFDTDQVRAGSAQEESPLRSPVAKRPQVDDVRRPPPEGDEQSGQATFAHERGVSRCQTAP